MVGLSLTKDAAPTRQTPPPAAGARVVGDRGRALRRDRMAGFGTVAPGASFGGRLLGCALGRRDDGPAV
ncbi:MAG: hypothetical protein EBR82_03990 [Caulobacteraceae bacterium]|nr:hypothetical protein [Caulobacteraceae bacterium]